MYPSPFERDPQSQADNTASEAVNENREQSASLVRVKVLEKSESRGGWSIVPLHHYTPPTHSIKIALPNGNEKWVGVSEAEYRSIEEGAEIPYSPKPWEDGAYLAKLQEIVDRSKNFDDLKAGFASIEIEDAHQRYDIDNLVEDLNNIEHGADLNAALVFLPDIPGLRKKLEVLSAHHEPVREMPKFGELGALSNENLLSQYRAIQDLIRDLIAKRDALDQGISKAHSMKGDLRDTQERMQRKIEDGFAILGSLREAIDDRALSAPKLGDIDQ